MIGEVFKDRFGQEIKMGTKVLYAEYDRNSSLYEGVVTRFTPKNIEVKNIEVKGDLWGTRRVAKDSVERQLISSESFKAFKEEKKHE